MPRINREDTATPISLKGGSNSAGRGLLRILPIGSVPYHVLSTYHKRFPNALGPKPLYPNQDTQKVSQTTVQVPIGSSAELGIHCSDEVQDLVADKISELKRYAGVKEASDEPKQ